MTEGEGRAWGWVAHLRAGGTTPWAQWRDPAPATGRVVPGAQQLELVRRINLVDRPGPELVQRILVASAPGRGSPDLELVGGGLESAFGPRPVDPGDLSAAELLRLATGLLADELVTTGLGDAPYPRRRLWRAHYLLVGDPAQVRPLAEALAAAGRPPGGRRARLLVLGAPVDRMLAGLWTEACFAGGVQPWAEWVAARSARRRMPPRVDLARIASQATQDLGAARVRVVLDQAAISREVGLRSLPSLPPVPSARAAELARRVAGVLGLLVPPADRPRYLREVLAPRLADPGAPPLAVPDQQADWVARQGRRMRDALLAGRYAVLGGPDAVLATGTPGARPTEADALDLAVRLLLRGPDREGRP